MADREEIIRIILDGRDKLSRVAQNAAKNLDKSLDDIRSSYSGVEKGQRDLEKAFDRTRKTLDEQGRSLRNAKKDVDGLTSSVRKLASESGAGAFARGLKEGFRIVEQENERLNGLLGRNTEARKKAEDEIKERARLRIEDAERAEDRLKKKARDRSFDEKKQIRETKDARLRALEETDAKELESFRLRTAIAEGFLKTVTKNIDKSTEESIKKIDEIVAKQTERARDKHAKTLADIESRTQQTKKIIEDIVEQRKRDAEDAIGELVLQRKQSEDWETDIAIDKEIKRLRRATTLVKIREQVLKELSESGQFDFQDFADEIAQANQDLKDVLRSIEKGRQKDTKAAKEAAKEEKEQVKDVFEERIRSAEAAEKEIRAGHKETVKQEIAEELRASDNWLQARLKVIRNAGLARRRTIRTERDEEIRGIGNESNDAIIVAQSRENIAKLVNEGNRLDRVAKRIGRSFADLRLGARDGGNGLRELSKEARKSESVFTRFGFAIGKAKKEMGGFINLRWATLVGFLTVFLTYALRLGAVLVALAGSALYAAGALGGALVAGISQAIPVVGLLAIAFQRLGKVMDALKQAEQNRLTAADDAKAKTEEITQANQAYEDSQWSVKKAVEAVADAHYAVKEAHEGVLDAIRNHRNALEALSDAQYDLRESQKSINDAMKDNKKAIQDLAQARIQAAQDIKDANLNEQEAALSLQEAELALIDAKRKLREENNKQNQQNFDVEGARAAVREAEDRLKKARAEGDQAEISKAAQQAAIAQQNLNAILDQASSQSSDLKELELGVKRAEINVKQAKARNTEAKRDARRARSKGVEGSDGVISAKEEVTRTKEAIVKAQRDFALALRGVRNAREDVKDALSQITKAQRGLTIANRGVRDAVHALAVAKREEADARKKAGEAAEKETAGQKKLKEILADFSPSERKVYASAKKLQDLYRKVFVGTSKKDGILGPINEALSGVIDEVFKLLADPKIQKALKNLASAIGDGFQELGKLIGSKDFKDNLLFFIREATENLPTAVEIFGKLFKIFTNVGRAASPLFKDLLGSINNWLDKLVKVTSDKERMEKFFQLAGKHLKAWIDFAGAVGNLILALAGGGAKEGKTTLEGITEQLNKWADWIRDNPEKVQKFFSDMRESLGRLTRLLFRFIQDFTKLLASKDFEHFAEFFLETFIPAVGDALALLGKLAGIFNKLTGIPVIGDVAKLVIQFFILRKVLYFLLPVSKIVGAALGTVIKELGRFLLFGTKIAFIGRMIEKFKLLGTLLSGGGIAKGIKLIGAALRFVFIANPWIGAIIAAIGLIVLLDKKFHFLKPTIKFLEDRLRNFGKSVIEFFRHPIRWLKNNWETLLKAALFGPMAPIYLLFKKQIDRIAGYIATGFINGWKAVGKWFANIGTWLYDHIIKPILKFFHIASPSKLMYNIGKQIVQGLVNAFLELPGLILGVFKKLPGMILGAISFGPKFIFDLIKKIPGLDKVKDIVKDALGGAKKAAGKVKDTVVNTGKSVAGKAKDIATGALGIFGGGINKEDVINKANEAAFGVLNAAGPTIEGSVAVLRNKGVSDAEILMRFQNNGVLSKKRVDALKKKAKTDPTPIYSLGGAGLLQDGNINLMNRPRVKTKDGSIATVRSITVTADTEDGPVYILIPTVIGNKIVSDKEAIKRFKRTGLNFGIFDSNENAKIYAHKLHVQQANLLKMATGGKVPGSGTGDIVPAMLSPGEWVLNKGQQDRVAKFLGVTAQQLQAMIFGTNMGSKGPKSSDGLVRYRSGANLIPQTDEDGNQVWFIQLKNGTFGQVTGRDAAKIQATDGQWIPQYVRRSKAGFQGKLKIASQFNNFSSAPFHKKYALGGVIGYAGGGVVQNPGFNQINKGNNVHQNFNVTTQGETDWAYVMRLSAITAQGAF